MKRIRPPQPPLKIKNLVALKQLLALEVNIFQHSRRDGEMLKEYRSRIMALLAEKLGCAVADLCVDHDPALRLRTYRPRNGRPVASWYTPHAHDPAFLRWRPHGPEFDGSHHVKTNIRGEHGQFSDTVLIKRERRREKTTVIKKVKGFTQVRKVWNPLGPRYAKRSRPIQSRPFASKGSRPFNRRKTP